MGESAELYWIPLDLCGPPIGVSQYQGAFHSIVRYSNHAAVNFVLQSSGTILLRGVWSGEKAN